MKTDSVSKNLPWFCYTYAAFDLEGSGAQDKEHEEILEVASVLIKNKKMSNTYFVSLINPKRPLKKLPWIYLTNEQLRGAPTFEDVKTPLQNFLQQTVIIAHNAKIDVKLLNLKGATISTLAVIDTLRMAKAILKREKNTLYDLIALFNLNEAIINTGAIDSTT